MSEIVTGAMGTLLPKLGDLLTEEYKLQKGVKGEIMFLKTELESMETALLKISEAPIDQPPDMQVKLWAKAVRDLSYDLEDNIDKFMVRIESHEPEKPHSFMGYINRSINLLTKGKISHKIGIDVKDIKSRIMEVSERRDRYKVDIVAAKPIGPTIDRLRLSALYNKATDLIGTKEKSEKLLNMLEEGDEMSKKQLKMVAISGFGGLGKTTLANMVYQKLKVQFDCGAFVSISLSPHVEKIFKSMLHQLDDVKYRNIGEAKWGEAELINELRKFLQNKRYIIVIDDIWDKNVWKIIEHALIENEYGSRVLATTRNLDVAKEVGGVYQLESLSTIDSRKLFNQRIFGSEGKHPPEHFAELSNKILKKCGGIPLAIITTASLLASKEQNKNSHKYWSMVYQSMGSGLENSHEDLQNMRKILSVSYDDLPPHLKTCLLYLSLYPEDYKIKASDLIWKWIGEGFVKKEYGKSLYEVGEDYFCELIDRSLVQLVDIDSNSKARSCRVHDMVLDLIISLSNEENFLTALGGQQLLSVPSKVRRLSLQTSKEEDCKRLSAMSLSHVRSLTVFSAAFSLLSTLSVFPVLRALDLSGCRQVDNHHCKDICDLFHLRYLNLARTYITEIPKEIGNLQFLQVLDINSTKMKKLPSTFVQLRALVSVDMCNRAVSALLLRSMSSLPSLSSLAIALERLGEKDLQVLGGMPSLCDLRITVARDTEGRDKGLVIDNDCPFRCLTRFCIWSNDTMELVFTHGAMQKLQILELKFNIRKTKARFCDFDFGLEKLSSLEHVCVKLPGGRLMSEDMRNAFRKVLDVNPNKPTLEVKAFSSIKSKLKMLRLLVHGAELSIEE